MLRTKSRLFWLLALMLSLTMVAAACGGDDEDEEGTSDTSAENGSTDGGGSASGTVNISGSSTVAPISTRVAEMFADVNPDVSVNVDGPGTGDGFVLFCDGETDVSDASRPISEEEVATCEENGVEYIELKVAIDGLSVMTNEANDAVECVSFADIYALVGPESQGVDRWSDAQELATELGSDSELPDASLDVFGPGEESGTYDSFVELVIEEFNEDRGAEAQTRPDYQSSADDNVIIQGIQGSETSFGWVGYAFAKEASGVKLLEVAGEGDCVAPTDETIASGEYPIARDLYIYVNTEKLEASPALEEYVDFYLSDEGIAAATEVGYVGLAEEDLEATRGVWESKETGTRDGG